MDLTIRPLNDASDARAFRELNEEWIARHFTIEDQDRRQLEDPVAAYIAPGGGILIAELRGRPIGCVALMPSGTGAYELSKMAVSPELRGQGAGRALLGAAIDHAQALGARSLFLGTSRRLPNAVHLYESLGFQHVAPEMIHMPYARADVFMQLIFPGATDPLGPRRTPRIESPGSSSESSPAQPLLVAPSPLRTALKSAHRATMRRRLRTRVAVESRCCATWRPHRRTRTDRRRWRRSRAGARRRPVWRP